MFRTFDFFSLIARIFLISSSANISFAETGFIHPCGCHSINIPKHFLESTATSTPEKCERYCESRGEEVVLPSTQSPYY